MLRHRRTNCKATGRTVTAQTAAMAALKQQLEELTELTKRLEQQMQQSSSVTTQTNTVNNFIHISIHPWDCGQRIHLDESDFLAAFAERLPEEWLRQSIADQTNAETGPPYVAALLMALLKRSHADPARRNILLNPKRADQALVLMGSGKWKAESLVEASRAMLDGVAEQAKATALAPPRPGVESKLTNELKSALSLASMLYADSPESYVARTKPSIVAHLENMRAESAQFQ